MTIQHNFSCKLLQIDGREIWKKKIHLKNRTNTIDGYSSKEEIKINYELKQLAGVWRHWHLSL